MIDTGAMPALSPARRIALHRRRSNPPPPTTLPGPWGRGPTRPTAGWGIGRAGVRHSFRITGIPSWVMLPPERLVRSRLTSLVRAASRLTLRPSTSPSQPLSFASTMRSVRLRMISIRRVLCVGSTRSIEHRIHASLNNEDHECGRPCRVVDVSTSRHRLFVV